MDPKSTHPHARATTIGRVIGLTGPCAKQKKRLMSRPPRSNAETPDTDDPVSDHHPREPLFSSPFFPSAQRRDAHRSVRDHRDVLVDQLPRWWRTTSWSARGACWASGSYVEANAALEAGTVVEPAAHPFRAAVGRQPRAVRARSGRERGAGDPDHRQECLCVAADHADQQTPWGSTTCRRRRCDERPGASERRDPRLRAIPISVCDISTVGCLCLFRARLDSEHERSHPRSRRRRRFPARSVGNHLERVSNDTPANRGGRAVAISIFLS